METNQVFVLLLILMSLIPLSICIKKKEKASFSMLGIMLFGLFVILGLILLISFIPFIGYVMVGILILLLIRELIEIPKIY